MFINIYLRIQSDKIFIVRINISKRILSNKLHELLVQEIDFEDSEINRYINNVALNIILKSLTQEKRTEFYKLLHNDDFTSAQTLIKKEIPDFNKQILLKVKEKFIEIL